MSAQAPKDIYCGIRPCGCVVTIISQTAPLLDENLATMRSHGLSVQLLPSAEAIRRITVCKCARKPAQMGLFKDAA